MPELLRPEPPRSLARPPVAPARRRRPRPRRRGGRHRRARRAGGWWLVPTGAAPGRSATCRWPAPSRWPRRPPSSPVEVVVQVAGAVAQPGVYRLADGRGSSTSWTRPVGRPPDADLQALALASRLTDGQRVQVPRQGEVPRPPSVRRGARGRGDGQRRHARRRRWTSTWPRGRARQPCRASVPPRRRPSSPTGSATVRSGRSTTWARCRASARRGSTRCESWCGYERARGRGIRAPRSA